MFESVHFKTGVVPEHCPAALFITTIWHLPCVNTLMSRQVRTQRVSLVTFCAFPFLLTWGIEGCEVIMIKMQLDVDVSPSANIITFRLGLTHLAFDPDTFFQDAPTHVLYCG